MPLEIRTPCKAVLARAACAAAVALVAPARAADLSFNVTQVGHLNPIAAQFGFGTNNFYANLHADGNLVALGSITGTGVVFTDISNPAAPSFLSWYDPPNGAGGRFQDVVISGNVAYCAIDDTTSTNGGIHVLDVSNPASPVKLSEIRQGATFASGFARNHTIFLDGQLLYAASNVTNVVKVFNVSNPAAPTHVRDIATTGNSNHAVHQITVKNGRLYTSNIINGLLEVYDVSDVTSGSWTTSSRRVTSFNATARNHSSWVNDAGTLIAVCRETSDGDVQLWDVSNPAAPTQVGSITRGPYGIDGFTPHNPIFVGDTLLVSWYQAGLQIFNVKNPAAPVHLGAFDTFSGGTGAPGGYLTNYDGNWGLFPFQGMDRILLSDMDSGLFVVDASAAFRKVWTHNANDGKWQENARWASGAGPYPDSSEMIASFTSAAVSSNRTVTVDGALPGGNPRVAGIEFLNNRRVVLQAINGGEIEMLSSAGPATITVHGSAQPVGSTISAPLHLADDLLVNNNGTFNNEPALMLGAVRGSNRTMTFKGTGVTWMDVANPNFTGNVVVDGGWLHVRNAAALNAQPITLSGGGTLQIGTTATSGTFSFGSDLTVTGNAQLRVSPFNNGPGPTYALGDVTVAAGQTLDVLRSGGAPLSLQDVSIAGTMKITPAIRGVATKVQTLAVQPGGKLDLTNDRLVVAGNVAGAWNGSAYTGVSGMVQSGRNEGTWDGSGIVTSMPSAQNGDYATLGVATAGDVLGLATGETADWHGVTVVAANTLIAYTYGGDANLDGIINIDDYGQIDFNVGLSGVVFGWFNGDFNYDGLINIDDYGIIDFNVGIQTVPYAGGAVASMTAMGDVAAVPEPTSGAVTLLAAPLFLRRRRRGRPQ